MTWPFSVRPDTRLRLEPETTGSIVWTPAESQVAAHEPTMPATTPASLTSLAVDGAGASGWAEVNSEASQRTACDPATPTAQPVSEMSRGLVPAPSSERRRPSQSTPSPPEVPTASAAWLWPDSCAPGLSYT